MKAVKAVIERPLKSVLAAEFLGIGIGTLQRMRQRGIGPKWIRIEGSIVYPWADLRQYVASRPGGGEQVSK